MGGARWRDTPPDAEEDPRMSRLSFKTLAFAGAASLVLAGCATVPGSNVAAGSPITPAERQQGTEADPQLIA